MNDGYRFRIIDDSGVDYNFLSITGNAPRWLGQIVWGTPSFVYPGAVTVQQPFQPVGCTYTADAKCFQLLPDCIDANRKEHRDVRTSSLSSQR